MHTCQRIQRSTRSQSVSTRPPTVNSPLLRGGGTAWHWPSQLLLRKVYTRTHMCRLRFAGTPHPSFFLFIKQFYNVQCCCCFFLTEQCGTNTLLRLKLPNNHCYQMLHSAIYRSSLSRVPWAGHSVSSFSLSSAPAQVARSMATEPHCGAAPGTPPLRKLGIYRPLLSFSDRTNL